MYMIPSQKLNQGEMESIGRGSHIQKQQMFGALFYPKEVNIYTDSVCASVKKSMYGQESIVDSQLSGLLVIRQETSI